MSAIVSHFEESQDNLEEAYSAPFSWNNHSPSRLSYFDQSVSLPDAREFRNDVELESNAFSERQVQDEREQLAESDSGGGERRVNNTVFKTSLSQYRKSIIDVVKRAPNLQFLKEVMQGIYVSKNQSIFPKLLSMVRALKIQKEVLVRWRERKQKLVEKKGKLLKAGKYTQKRLIELQKTIKMMDQSLKKPSLQRSFDIYWGKYRQHEKYQKCKAEVMEFDVGFRSQYSYMLERSQRSTTVEYRPKTKKDKVGKNKMIEKKPKPSRVSR